MFLLQPVQPNTTEASVKACEEETLHRAWVNVSSHVLHKFTPLWNLGPSPWALPPVRKRVKVEFVDDNGTRYSLAVEGKVSREKVLKIIDLMELVEGQDSMSQPALDSSTVFGRLFKLIEDSYAAREFSSADIARDYEEQQGVSIGLSTVSTYLCRLADRGMLKRQKFGNSWVYRRAHLQTDHLASM